VLISLPNDTILESITQATVLQLAEDRGLKMKEGGVPEMRYM